MISGGDGDDDDGGDAVVIAAVVGMKGFGLLHRLNGLDSSR